ncbi:MAG: type II toxin-antitoxin system Phd/YefM family antitoxin [Anaerolineae bacterium]
MALEITLAEAKLNLLELVQQVAQKGERFVLAAQGQPQAVLIPVADWQILETLKSTGKTSALSRVFAELRKVVEEGDWQKSRNLLEEIDDFPAVPAVADEPARPWDEFISE